MDPPILLDMVKNGVYENEEENKIKQIDSVVRPM